MTLYLDFHGTGRQPEVDVIESLRERIDLSPCGIIERFQLRRPIYAATSAYGHFGRDTALFPWEQVDMGLASTLSQAQLHAR